jgi:hypothetical protein
MISFIIATVGRPSLADTLASIECWPGDEIIVIGNVPTQTDGHIRYVACPPGHDWGSTERNIATPLSRGQYLAHIDDDDVYVPGHRALMASAIEAAPDRLTIFRMRLPDGTMLWQDQMVRWGNVGTPMIFMPNEPAKLGTWGERQDCGDLHFLQTMHWGASEIVWRPEVLTQLGRGHA